MIMTHRTQFGLTLPNRGVVTGATTVEEMLASQCSRNRREHTMSNLKEYLVQKREALLQKCEEAKTNDTGPNTLRASVS
jgi:hypothetical protein